MNKGDIFDVELRQVSGQPQKQPGIITFPGLNDLLRVFLLTSVKPLLGRKKLIA